MTEKQEMRMIRVPLDALERHVDNVRVAPSDEDADTELAASIRAHGLLAPLIVEGSEERARVIGGGRRLAALRGLADDGDLPRDHRVACVLVGGGRAGGLAAVTELSLAENSGRERLHPVDQAQAFAALRDAGATDRELAARFGTSPRTVQRRLRIARIAPALLEQARRGDLPLGVLEACAVTDDHEEQIQAVEESEDMWRRADCVRRALTPAEAVPARSDLGLFVGLEAYEAAGGEVRPCAGPAGDLMLEPGTVQRLAGQRLDALADAEEGRGWGEITCGLDTPKRWWETYQAAGGPAGSLEPDPDARLHITLGAEGEPRWVALTPLPAETAAEGDDDAEPAADGEADAGSGISQALRLDLASMKASLERAALAGEAGLGRDLILMAMCGRPGEARLTLRPRWAGGGLPDVVPSCVSRAQRRLEIMFAQLTEWASEPTPEARWSALRAMPPADRDALLGVCAARLLVARGAASAWDPVEAELAIDWEREWRPDAALLGRMTRAQLIAAAERSLGAQDPRIDEMREMSRAGLAGLLAGILSEERRSWLPPEVWGEGA